MILSIEKKQNVQFDDFCFSFIFALKKKTTTFYFWRTEQRILNGYFDIQVNSTLGWCVASNSFKLPSNLDELISWPWQVASTRKHIQF